jgi:hypothetical protein
MLIRAHSNVTAARLAIVKFWMTIIFLSRHYGPIRFCLVAQ